ncbi:hypothetical protein ARAM_003041 [Aspergillus rambellii]|uniref:NB-ARC domain-containing protein n=1 Tax=Aspergillus rambellii TaxID=308745 RepID=A0A0F8VSS3_9EURO|nr:hypothetical protein ARAM_003041 [Aspergillus rambellii]
MADSIDKSLTLARSWQHLWVVPPGFHRNASFFGMQKEIDVLHARLFKAKKRAENLMAVLICGVPGSGKSHLARQYVWTHREHYPGGIFWVDAKSCQSTYKCLWDIAQAATLTDGQEFQSADAKSSTKYVEAVRNWLQSRDEWLLVFDGISFGNDEEINHFKQFLPFRERCSIIYTSVDKTLRKKQRLYEPYCLLISPLQAEDACKLLFKDLGIKRPTAEQVRKATEVVNHYECLPLAIHAISHRLSATDKPIEKYHIDSHLTDEKLAEPFLSIMHDLYRREHFAALNLINLLSFLGHHVPVGLITLGKSFLDAWNIEIVTSSRHGERGDFDTTLGILIRYGLIERTSDIYPLDPISSSPRLEKCPVDMKTVIPELSESQTESSQEGFFSAYQTSGVSDVIKIHSVVQGFCRDELKILDKELKGRLHLGNSGNTDAGYYDSWLVVATRVFCKSYGNARSRMDRVDDCGLVKDYREYETHASQLIKNFPKKTSYDIVREARDELKQVVKSIRNEIDRISPSSSQESIRKHRSVFDRSSSSSSFPESTTSDGPSRQLTWDFSDVVSSKAESPQEMRMSPHHVNLGPIIPHIYRNASRDKYDGYLTDDEGLKAFTRTSPAMSQISQGTERPRSSQASSPPQQVDDEGWHVVENPSRNKPAKPRKSKSTARFPRHIRDSRPAAPILERTPAEWRSVSDTDKRKAGPLVSASEVLSAVQKASPPPAHASIVRQDRDKENVITYAYVASRFSQDQLNSTKQRSSSSPGGRTRPVFSGGQSRSSVESLHSNVPFSSLSTEFKADPLSQSTYSEPDQGLLQELNALDLRITPDSRYNGHRISASRRVAPLADMSASTPSILNSLPYDSNIEIQVPRRGKGVSTLALSQTSTNLRSIPHPSAIMPGASPPSSQILDVSTSYASDPALEPMSRGPSGQSHHSWSTEPSRHPPGPSALPSHLQFAGPHHFVPQQQTLSGAGSWVSDLGQYPRQPLLSTSALHVDTSYAGIATKRAIPPLDTNVSNLDPVWDPPTASSVHFGAHRVDLHDARQRLEGYRHQYQLQARQQYQIYHDNRSGPLLAQEPAVWPLQMRARSGSSPSSPGFNGLGLDI